MQGRPNAGQLPDAALQGRLPIAAPALASRQDGQRLAGAHDRGRRRCNPAAGPGIGRASRHEPAQCPASLSGHDTGHATTAESRRRRASRRGPRMSAIRFDGCSAARESKAEAGRRHRTWASWRSRSHSTARLERPGAVRCLEPSLPRRGSNRRVRASARDPRAGRHQPGAGQREHLGRSGGGRRRRRTRPAWRQQREQQRTSTDGASRTTGCDNDGLVDTFVGSFELGLLCPTFPRFAACDLPG